MPNKVINKVTFPHMGESFRAFKMLLEDLGNEVILPPRPSRKTLDLGVQYAPEFACLPLKILLGTYMETAQKGANLIVTSGGVGPCRAGQYAQLHKAILSEQGYDMDMVVFEPPKLYPLDFIRNVRKLNVARLSYRAVYQCIKRSWRKLKALDSLEKYTHVIRPREQQTGVTSRIYKDVLAWIDQANSIKEIKEAENAGLNELQKIPQDQYRIIVKVGLVGEIYVLLEPASNLEIEETLGNLGVEVERSMFLTGWTVDNTIKETTELLNAKDAASPYLPEMVGGHGRDSVGHTILYSQRGFDGVIQLAPFTCIPEIVAKTVLNTVGKEYNMPILTFFLDEQTGKAGIATRLEAFVDLMKRKQKFRTSTANS